MSLHKSREIIPSAAPMSGWFKFNVDGASSGNPGPAGIGGILRGSMGSIKVTFSKSVGECDSNLAEFLVIKEAFIIFAASRWCSSSGLIIETDSANACQWAKNPDEAPWKLRKICLQMEVFKRKVKNWRIDKIFRESNQEADILAKEGKGRSQEFLQFLD